MEQESLAGFAVRSGLGLSLGSGWRLRLDLRRLGRRRRRFGNAAGGRGRGCGCGCPRDRCSACRCFRAAGRGPLRPRGRWLRWRWLRWRWLGWRWLGWRWLRWRWLGWCRASVARLGSVLRRHLGSRATGCGVPPLLVDGSAGTRRGRRKFSVGARLGGGGGFWIRLLCGRLGSRGCRLVADDVGQGSLARRAQHLPGWRGYFLLGIGAVGRLVQVGGLVEKDFLLRIGNGHVQDRWVRPRLAIKFARLRLCRC